MPTVNVERSNQSLASPLKWLLIIILLIIISIIILLSTVPPVSRDALTHHLFIPKLYLNAGGMIELPDYVFSYYPMNLDLLYMIPLYFGNDIIPKYIHFAFALFTAWLIYRYLSRFLSPLWGLFGALYFLTIPIIFKLSVTVYVDLGLIAFSFASLLALFKWSENNFQAKHLIVAAIWSGLAAGCKYNGLVTVFLLTLFVIFLYLRLNSTQHTPFKYTAKALSFSTLFLLISFIVLSPWLIRNYVWTGNPIYPLFNSLFTVSSQVDPGESDYKQFEKLKSKAKTATSMGTGVFAKRKILYNETLTDIVLLPIRYFYQGKDDDPQYFDGKLTPLLLILPILAFFRRYESKHQALQIKMLAWFSFLYFFLVFFQYSMRIRYISPILPALSVLSIIGFANLIYFYRSSSKKYIRIIIGIFTCSIIAFMIVFRTAYVTELFHKISPSSYLSGTLSRDEYISHHIGEYDLVNYANDNLPQDSTILGIFIGNRGYYFDNRILFDRNNTQSYLVNVTNKSQTTEEIKKALQTREITHLLINRSLFLNFADHALASEKKPLLSEFFQNHCRKLEGDDNFVLLELLPR